MPNTCSRREITDKDVESCLGRFMDKIFYCPITGCWLWGGTLNGPYRGWPTGYEYGRFFIGIDRYVLAHRFSYKAFVGNIPDSEQIDHLCKNPRCVNPAHLQSVTPMVNGKRSLNVGSVNGSKTHCPHGHEYNKENTYVYKRGNGLGRTCRECSRLRCKAKNIKVAQKT